MHASPALPAASTAAAWGAATDTAPATAPAIAATAAGAGTAGRAATELYGSFLLGGAEFALPASAIREVVNFPERLTPVPLSPPYLAGMFTLRGAVIPVVNLARLFDPGAGPAQPQHKIAIVLHQEVLVGILFDATGEVLRVRPEQLSRLDYPGQGQAAPPGDGEPDRHGPQAIAGAILLQGGARLIQVLNPVHLVRIENVPQVVALRAAQAPHLQLARQGRGRRVITFRAGGSRFALDIAAVQEIILPPALQPSLLNSPLCLGHFNFRGQSMAAVDFAVLLGAQAAGGTERRVIVLRTASAAIGLLVDGIDSIVACEAGDVMPIPLLGKARAAMFAGCLARSGEDDVIVLAHDGIFSHAEVQAMHRGHAALFGGQQPGQPADAGHGAKRSRRKVYLLFHVHERYAVEILQVREILELSGNVARPPGMPAHMHGILKLRQHMISLVDLRQLYGLPPPDATDGRKLLVIDHELGGAGDQSGDGHRQESSRGEPVGLLVDSVDSIVTIDDSHRYATPSLMRHAGGGGLQAESSEVLEVPGPDGATQSVCLIDCRKLAARLEALAPA